MANDLRPHPIRDRRGAGGTGGTRALTGSALLATALAIASLPLFGPERRRRRLLAAARELVPDRDGWVALVGTARETGALLTAPYSRRHCIAYWARRVAADHEDSSRDAGTDTELRTASCDFVLEIGEQWVLVTAEGAQLAFDRSLGEVVSFAGDELHVEPVTRAHRGRDRSEEILLRPGERVAVRGMLARGAGDGAAPYRASARLLADRRRPVVIAIGVARRPRQGA